MLTEMVTIFNEKGEAIGKKARKDIDKSKDIFSTVYGRIFVDNKILLVKISQKQGGIIKTNEGKWGLPVATILREGEDPTDALERASLDDIGVMLDVIKKYHKVLRKYESTSPRIIYVYDAVLEIIPVIEGRDFILVAAENVKELYERGILAETALLDYLP